MPNGGVPMHMVLYPKDCSPYVLYCKGGNLFIYNREVWDKEKANGKPFCSVNTDEAAALAWFLKYWLGETALVPGYKMGNTINADFDF
jgi:hypothetical protein